MYHITSKQKSTFTEINFFDFLHLSKYERHQHVSLLLFSFPTRPTTRLAKHQVTKINLQRRLVVWSCSWCR